MAGVTPTSVPSGPILGVVGVTPGVPSGLILGVAGVTPMSVPSGPIWGVTGVTPTSVPSGPIWGVVGVTPMTVPSGPIRGVVGVVGLVPGPPGPNVGEGDELGGEGWGESLSPAHPAIVMDAHRIGRQARKVGNRLAITALDEGEAPS